MVEQQEQEINFEKKHRLIREIIETVVLTVLMFLIIRLAVQNFNVDGMSMEPGLHNNELILVDKWSYFLHAPSRGDVIVFAAPPKPSEDYVKRVIGLPGDLITIQDTTVIVNGKTLTETYIDPNRQGNPYPPLVNRVVPPDMYFVLGDNRNGSSDSRDWGCVPKKNIIGRAALIYWPLGQDNDGLLPSVSPVFQSVPAAAASAPENATLCNVLPDAEKISQQAPIQPLANTALLLLMPTTLVVWRGRQQKSSLTKR